MTWVERYRERFYSTAKGWTEGNTDFHAMCAANIPAGAAILDIGAGRTNATSEFLATLGTVIGVDVDPSVATNVHLSSSHVVTGADAYPLADASVDACVSNYVLEHLSDPRQHFAEVKRVLKPGGVYLFRTPNTRHYTTIVSRLTPHWVHEFLILRLQGTGPFRHAPHPTFYRVNCRTAIRRTAAATGLTVRELRMVEKEPSYGMKARILFLLFTAYERVVNRFDALSEFRVNVYGVVQKPSTPSGNA